MPPAALYELVRRHPRVKLLLLGKVEPESNVELFLAHHARSTWQFLAAEHREEFCSLIETKMGRNRPEVWLQIIAEFEGTELSRFIQFNEPSRKHFADPECEEAKRHFQSWGSEEKRKTPEKKAVNQKQRRAFEKACDRAFCHVRLA